MTTAALTIAALLLLGVPTTALIVRAIDNQIAAGVNDLDDQED